MDDSRVSPLHGSEDRLSELPDSLILLILSFLPFIDVVRTTLLSKRWKDLWTTVPSLHFRHTNSDQFRKLIYWSLPRWEGAKILKFSIDISFDTSMEGDIDLLLLYAISKQVEDLELHLDLKQILWPFQKISYHPPPHLYSCSSISKLSLSHVNLNIVESVTWNQLKSLTIQGADPLTEATMNHIITGAPLLEVLNLRIKESGENLNIRSSSLKMVKIIMCCSDAVENDTVLRIFAPKLQILEICGLSYTRCLFKVPSLTNAVLGFDELDYFTLLGEMLRQIFPSIYHVQKLSLTDWCIKFLVDEMKNDKLVLFSNANILNIYPVEADGILDVLEMFPELMILVIEHNELQQMQFNSLFQDEDECYARDSLAPKTIFPNQLSLLQLKIIHITWNVQDTSSIIPVIESLLENAHLLEKMVIQLRNHEADPETFTLAEEKVLSISRSSPYAEVSISKVG